MHFYPVFKQKTCLQVHSAVILPDFPAPVPQTLQRVSSMSHQTDLFVFDNDTEQAARPENGLFLPCRGHKKNDTQIPDVVLLVAATPNGHHSSSNH
jgi:hypothetical protein